MRIHRCFVALAGALLLLAGTVVAQEPGDVNRVLVSRAALEDLANRLEATSQSSAFTGVVRDDARRKAVLVRQRLRDGDFQVGDRIYLRVEAESSLSDTFTIRGGRELQLPGIPAIPLTGVLRVELTDHLNRVLSQYVRDPRVRAQALIRLAVFGQVFSQGFITVPVDIPVDEVLRQAGGLRDMADADQLRIERVREVLYDGDNLQLLIAQGRTLDELSIQAGDRIIIPERKVRNPLMMVQTIQILLTLPITIYGLVQLFN